MEDHSSGGHTPEDPPTERELIADLAKHVHALNTRMDTAAKAIGALSRPIEDYTDRPKKTIDWSGANADLLKSLVAAQSEIRTVGKTGENADAGYKYATADAMIAEGRRARSNHGLGLVTSWDRRVVCAKPRDASIKRWHSVEVTLDWVLFHEGGGMVRGQIRIDGFSTGRTPVDKATAAAATYCEGFLERGLMRIDRAIEDPHDVDARKEEDAPAKVDQPRKGKRLKAPADPEIEGLQQKLREALDEHAGTVGGKISPSDLLTRAMGRKWPGKKAVAKDYRDAITGIDLEIQQVNNGGPAPYDENGQGELA